MPANNTTEAEKQAEEQAKRDQAAAEQASVQNWTTETDKETGIVTARLQ